MRQRILLSLGIVVAFVGAAFIGSFTDDLAHLLRPETRHSAETVVPHMIVSIVLFLLVSGFAILLMRTKLQAKTIWKIVGIMSCFWFVLGFIFGTTD